jgi:hypothetical protein
MPDKKFLEEYPLYRKFYMKIPSRLDDIPKPGIHMNCPNCNSEETFTMTNNYYDRDNFRQGAIQKSVFGEYRDDPPDGAMVIPIYTCARCSSSNIIFMLKFADDSSCVLKIGQFPPWNTQIDKNLSKILGTHAENYKRGLTCESQSYGIGAYAYYRRIIEEIIDALLDSIEDLFNEPERRDYKDALNETKKTIVAKEKIALVKDLLPASLRPNGINPLNILHNILSEGIHTKTEEECLEIASTIRETLLYLVNQVIQTKESSKQFTDSMRKLLAKKSKRGA